MTNVKGQQAAETRLLPLNNLVQQSTVISVQLRHNLVLAADQKHSFAARAKRTSLALSGIRTTRHHSVRTPVDTKAAACIKNASCAVRKSKTSTALHCVIAFTVRLLVRRLRAGARLFPRKCERSLALAAKPHRNVKAQTSITGKAARPRLPRECESTDIPASVNKSWKWIWHSFLLCVSRRSTGVSIASGFLAVLQRSSTSLRCLGMVTIRTSTLFGRAGRVIPKNVQRRSRNLRSQLVICIGLISGMPSFRSH